MKRGKKAELVRRLNAYHAPTHIQKGMAAEKKKS